MRLAPLLVLLALTAGASAQPSGDALLDQWRAGWREAAAGVERVEMNEGLRRELDGPRGVIEIGTRAQLGYSAAGRPARNVRVVEIDGRRSRPGELRRIDRRLRRAFGRAADLLQRPPPLPGAFLASATATSEPDAVRLRGEAAWRFGVDVPSVRDGRVTLWLSRDDSPRLLRIRLDQRLPRDADARFEADYQRIRGLDLPVELATRVRLQQRRRLRLYTVELTAAGTYSRHRLVR